MNERKGSAWSPLWLAAALCLILLTLTLCVTIVANRGMVEAGRTARGALEAVESILHVTPTVTVSSYVARQTTIDIMELATVSKNFPQQYSFEHTLLGSTKKLVLRGDYSVKAGFDLRDRFAIQVDQKTGTIFADFPSPKVLSVQMNRYAVLEDEDGWWNALTPADREAAVNAMNEAARRSALEMNVLAEARESVSKRLVQYGNGRQMKWEITFREPAAAAPGGGVRRY